MKKIIQTANASILFLGQKSPWTNVSLDKSLLGQRYLWTPVPWTNVATPHNGSATERISKNQSIQRDLTKHFR